MTRHHALRRAFRTAALSAVVLLGGTAGAAADYYDAVTAYDRGDYATAAAEAQGLAAAGDGRAQLLLGRMHEAGQGVLQDYVRAHLLYNLAAATGVDGAAAARDALALRMTPQQVADAQALAAAQSAMPAAGAPVADTVTAETAAAHSLAGAAAQAEALDRQALVDLQWQLALHGYDPGPADGAAGPRTVAAIRHYQADAGLPVDGRPTRALLDHLQYTVPAVRNAAAPAPAALRGATVAAAGTGPLDQLEPGLRRIYVIGIQRELKARGYDPGPVDGVAGKRTRAAIRKYQAASGLPVDGQPSPALLNHLKFVGGQVAANH